MDEYVWIKPRNGNPEVLIGAHILAAFGSRIKVKDDDNNEYWISPEDIVRPMHSTSVSGVGDMVALGELQEYSILRNLQIRYVKDLIYTYIGSTLVAVNPYKSLPIYNKEKMLEYRKKMLGELPPHIFAVADHSYENMRKNLERRCIVISGESGAGKTESTKLFLQYLARISNKRFGKEQQILDSNPILEAFGNAQTICNDNSSRFGKYIEIYFNMDGSIHSAQIKQYLLEKSRIVSQSKHEQNYHIFYTMLKGLSTEEKQRLGLQDTSYNYLNKVQNAVIGEGQRTPSIHDIKSAMEVLSFSKVEIWNIFELLAAILHFGNVEYEEALISNIESVKVKSEKETQFLCNLLKVSKEDLINSLTKKTISTHGDYVVTSLSKQQAIDFRDAFVKRIYGNLFNFIVNKINEILFKNEKASNWYIGILDIFGFEAFERNSFEQLCINYANEKLHQFFINHVFKTEQELYVIEGINWKFVEYTDNKDILELIEVGSTSVLTIINDVSKFPKGTDQMILDKLIELKSEDSHFFKPKYKNVAVFGIQHFAGVVLYDVKDFLEKNHDTCSFDMKQLVESSENTFMKSIFVDDFEMNLNENFKKKTDTLASKFKTSLDLLMNELNQCQPFFIRCLKPNEMKKPQKFDRMLCLKQLRYSGITETTKVREAGYPVRYDYVQFVQRYRYLCPGVPLAHKTACKEATLKICQTVFKRLPRPDYRLGRTNIFLKPSEGLFLEKEREKILFVYAVKIQKAVRGWLERSRYRKTKKAVLLVENRWLELKRRRKLNRGPRKPLTKKFSQAPKPDIHYYKYLMTRLQAYCRGYLVRKTVIKKIGESKIKNKKSNKIEKDTTFAFKKFAQKYFQSKQDHHFTKKPIKTSLTCLVQPDNISAAKTIWVTILRYTGNLPEPVKSEVNIPVKAQLREILQKLNEKKDSGLNLQTDLGIKKDAQNPERIYENWLKTQSSSLEKLRFIVGHGIACSELRDEIYCQICKAITKNPLEKALRPAWELLSSCIHCFPPSDLFIPYLKAFIREGPDKYKSYCLFRLQRTIQNGARTQPPYHTEFEALSQQKPIDIQVFLLDGGTTTTKIDSATTARELLNLIAKRIQLIDVFGFSIVLAQELKYMSLGDGSDFVLDAISQCEQYSDEIGSHFEKSLWRLYLKKEMFAPWHNYIEDEVSNQLIFYQIVEGIKSKEYDCESKDLIFLIAQICYAIAGKVQQTVLSQMIDNYIPYNIIDASTAEVKQFKKKVIVTYEQMFSDKQVSEISVQKDVINYVLKNWVLQFSKFFDVVGSIRNVESSSCYPEGPLVVAVNSSGVLIIDESNEKYIIEELNFAEIQEITRKEVAESRGYILKIYTSKGQEISLSFKNSGDSRLHELLLQIIETLKEYSKYALSKNNFLSLDPTFFEIRKGDLIIMSEDFSGKDLIQNSWAEGTNSRSGEVGNFLHEFVDIIPTIKQPSEDLVTALSNKLLFKDKNCLQPNFERLKYHTLESYAEKFFRKEMVKTGKNEENKSKPLELWRYSKTKISQPLLAKLLNDKKLSAKATDIFVRILEYTEEQEQSINDDEKIIDKIFSPALEENELKDEVYCQVMKQLTSNPNKNSKNRAWELMWLMTGLFTCGEVLAVEVKKFLQSRRTIITARESLIRFNNGLTQNSRSHSSHFIEIKSMKQKPCYVLHKVYFPDNTHKYFQINSYSKIKDLKQEIITRLKLTPSKGFNLFLYIAKRLFLLFEDYYVFDYLQLLKKWMEKHSISAENCQYQIYFMKQSWKDVAPGKNKLLDLKFLFPQEYNKYIDGHYNLPVEDMVQLGAILYKINNNDEHFQETASKILPAKALELQKLEAWQKDIQSIKILVSKDECKIKFLKHLYKSPSYGSSYFALQPSKLNTSNYILYPKIMGTKSIV